MKKYLAQMLYALTSAYSRKDYNNRHQELPVESNIGKLFSIFAWGLDSVEEQADLIKLWDDLDYASGAVLDRYGANFGVRRISSDDRFYRLAIAVKVMAQLSGGDTDTVIKAAGALLDVGLSEILLEDIYPAKAAVYVDENLLSQERLDIIDQIALAIKRILVAGVGLRLYLRTHRTYRHDIMLLRGSYGEIYNLAAPASEDRTSLYAVQTSYGALCTPAVSAATPSIKRTGTARQDRAGGTIFHSHIKSKRID